MISTVIPVFNRADDLGRAVSSILSQEYRPLEIIIVDDGSSDDTPDVISVMCREYPGIIRSIRQKNQGAGLARQAGLEVVRGEYVQYLDSDDIVLPGKFTSQVKLLSKYPNCSIALGLTRGIPMRTSKNIPVENLSEHSDYLYPSILNYRWWTTSTPLYRYEAAVSAEWFNAPVLEDWDYEFQVASQMVMFCFLPEYVVDKSSDCDDQLSNYKDSKRELWLQSKANVIERITRQIFERKLSRKNESFTRFINKIIRTGEEALEYDRNDIANQMSKLAIKCLMGNMNKNFIKRLLLLNIGSTIKSLKIR